MSTKRKEAPPRVVIPGRMFSHEAARAANTREEKKKMLHYAFAGICKVDAASVLRRDQLLTSDQSTRRRMVAVTLRALPPVVWYGLPLLIFACMRPPPPVQCRTGAPLVSVLCVSVSLSLLARCRVVCEPQYTPVAPLRRKELEFFPPEDADNSCTVLLYPRQEQTRATHLEAE